MATTETPASSDEGPDAFARPLPEYVDIYERMAAPVSDASVVAGMLNTRHLDDDEAAHAVADYADALGTPATDPVRHGIPEDVLDAVV